MKTIKELLRDTKLSKSTDILILNDNNALVSIVDFDKKDVLCFYFLKSDGEKIYVMQEFGIDRPSFKIIFNLNLKEEGVILFEDKGGISIYDYENAKFLVLDNLFTHAYDSYENAYDELNAPNFLEDDKGIDSFGKYIICSIDFEFEYPNVDDGLVFGKDKRTFYLKFYYETRKGVTPIKIYTSLEALKENKSPLKDYGNVNYSCLTSKDEKVNPLIKFILNTKEEFKKKLDMHMNCLILAEEAIQQNYIGSLSENPTDFQNQVKLVLK